MLQLYRTDAYSAGENRAKLKASKGTPNSIIVLRMMEAATGEKQNRQLRASKSKRKIHINPNCNLEVESINFCSGASQTRRNITQNKYLKIKGLNKGESQSASDALIAKRTNLKWCLINFQLIKKLIREKGWGRENERRKWSEMTLVKERVVCLVLGGQYLCVCN